MKILLTGASSFSGYWFAKELAAAGHHVVAVLRGEKDSYVSGVRAQRVTALSRSAELAWGSSFGDERFLDLASAGGFDVLCHHAAQVGDYRSPTYDLLAAVAANTRNFDDVLGAMSERGLRACVITGSVFESDEGAGEPPLGAFSAYGVSKRLSAEIARFWCERRNVPLGKFVIPNPFGPLEEARFCAYLVRQWSAGQAAEVRTPDYVRDNIHVRLLAKAYAGFVADIAASRRNARVNPSGFVESQGRFAQRFAAEIGSRLGLEARVVLGRQTDFSEPLMRINTDPAVRLVEGWDDASAWDELADYYRSAAAG